MPRGSRALSSADAMKRTPFAAAALFLCLAAAARSQTPTPTSPPTPTPTPGPPTVVASGVAYATEDTARVNGVRMEIAPDGGVWFLEATVDRISVLRGTTITSWQLRPDDQRGANPVDFAAGRQHRLVPRERPERDPGRLLRAGQARHDHGRPHRVGHPRLDSRRLLQGPRRPLLDSDQRRLPPEGRPRRRSRSSTIGPLATFAYADMAVGPDGALWLVDFGNNRIVRYVPGAATETSWTFFDPAFGRLNPAEIRFDDAGVPVDRSAVGRSHRPIRPDQQHARFVLRDRQPDPLRVLPEAPVRHLERRARPRSASWIRPCRVRSSRL